MITKTFRITDEDLAALERAVPIMHEAISNMPVVYFRPDVQVAMEEAKRVLSDVRWDNGLFREIDVDVGGGE
ncbi:hypothetical protein [Luteibacter sp. E-22]|uniref:hypothetical protein n=1 Tax=Luteibacter sp. E-22 TaxID=3404050 RepID=UPI003CF93758